jgi:hypothetical protein
VLDLKVQEARFGFTGDQLGIGLTIAKILLSDERPTEEGEEAAALAFFNGEQWPEDVYQRRIKHGRPALVVNKLPAILGEAKANSVAPYSPEDIARAIVILVRRNFDAQRLFNYMCSSAAEMARDGCKTPEFSVA